MPASSYAIEVRSGRFSNEISWSLECNGRYVISDGPYGNFLSRLWGASVHAYSVDLPPLSSCVLSMHDSWGDGWDDATWSGLGQNDITLGWGYSGTHSFVVPQSPSSPFRHAEEGLGVTGQAATMLTEAAAKKAIEQKMGMHPTPKEAGVGQGRRPGAHLSSAAAGALDWALDPLLDPTTDKIGDAAGDGLKRVIADYVEEDKADVARDVISDTVSEGTKNTIGELTIFLFFGGATLSISACLYWLMCVVISSFGVAFVGALVAAVAASLYGGGAPEMYALR